MKVIIQDWDGTEYRLNLSDEQIKFAKWLSDKEILGCVSVIDEDGWEDIK